MSTGTMTTAEAAERLHVTARQVRRLVDSGAIREAGRVGRSILIDANSVLALAEQGTRQGRRWQEQTTWAVLAMLDGQHRKDWADASRRWHLRQRLARMDAADLVRSARARAEVRRYRASTSYLDTLSAEITRTGLSALSDAATARVFGMAVARADDIDGYLARERLDDVVERCFLTEDATGNVTLRLVGATNALLDPGGTAHWPVLALDLADSLDTRAIRAGCRVLDDMLARL